MIHLGTYAAILLAWGHQLKVGEDFVDNRLFTSYWYGLYIFVFGNLLFFRFLKPVYFFYRHRFYVEKFEKETPDTTSIYISGRHINHFKIQAGQFMKLTFLTKAFFLQSHPFSLSLMPTGKHMRVTIKNSGDFTKKISTIQEGTQVFIDGPYGVFTETKNQKALLLASGIGITPIRSLLEQMAYHKKDVILLYGNRKKADIIFKEELDQLAKKYKIPVYYFLSQEKLPGMIQGRIDKSSIQKLVKDIGEREVYICGPIPMITQVNKAIVELGVSSKQIHFEKFSL
jgi:predicted ferric reductase